MAGTHILFYPLAESDAVHDGHHDVAHDDTRRTYLGYIPSLLTIGGGQHFIGIFKRTPDILTDIVIIFHHQQNGTGIFSFGDRFPDSSHGCLCTGGLLVLGMGIGIIRQQAEGKATALIQRTFHGNLRLMQIGQRLHQCQSNAGTRRLMLAFRLIITVKDMRYRLRVDTKPGILHLNVGISLSRFFTTGE